MFAEHGRDAVLWDVSPKCLDGGVRSIRTRLEKSVEKGKLDPAQVAPILARVRRARGLRDLAGCGFVVEAVVEDLGAKKAVLAEVESVLDNDAIVATNTSSLRVAELATALGRPARFLGVHFFNPPTKLELVEVVGAPGTSPGVVSTVRELLVSCGKTPVTARDAPGFIVNRLLLLLVNEAARMVDQGVASAADIDVAMQLGALHPAGPLAVADLIGLDTCQRILSELHMKLGSSSYAPAESIAKRVAQGRLGRKTGAGFFEYGGG